MSEDDSSTSPENGEKKRSWLERLGSAFSSEPHTRDELVGILQTAQQDGLIAADTLRMMEGAISVAELTVGDVMIPRSHMVSLPVECPFIELMNEIWRVLAPDGRLYAVTPAWPHAEAFVDPTHVNVITEGTVDYFVGTAPLGRIYGFRGHFELLRQDWVNADEARSPDAGGEENLFRARQYETGHKRLAQRFRHWSRRMRGKPDERPPPRRHWLRWELRAIKPDGD